VNSNNDPLSGLLPPDLLSQIPDGSGDIDFAGHEYKKSVFIVVVIIICLVGLACIGSCVYIFRGKPKRPPPPGFGARLPMPSDYPYPMDEEAYDIEMEDGTQQPRQSPYQSPNQSPPQSPLYPRSSVPFYPNSRSFYPSQDVFPLPASQSPQPVQKKKKQKRVKRSNTQQVEQSLSPDQHVGRTSSYQDISLSSIPSNQDSTSSTRPPPFSPESDAVASNQNSTPSTSIPSAEEKIASPSIASPSIASPSVASEPPTLEEFGASDDLDKTTDNTNAEVKNLVRRSTLKAHPSIADLNVQPKKKKKSKKHRKDDEL